MMPVLATAWGLFSYGRGQNIIIRAKTYDICQSDHFQNRIGQFNTGRRPSNVIAAIGNRRQVASWGELQTPTGVVPVAAAQAWPCLLKFPRVSGQATAAWHRGARR
jgi:hypothetical protein